MRGIRLLLGRAPAPAAAALWLAASLAFTAIPPAGAQNAGTANLLSAPGSWPTTGAVSGMTGLALDPLALYTNPAGLSTQDERSLLFHHGLLAFGTSWDLAAVSYPIPGLGAVGAGFAHIGTAGIDAYDAQNRPLGSIGYGETSAAAGVSRHIGWGLWGGAAFKVLSQSLGDVSAAAPAVDLGLLARPSVLRGAQVGLSLQNVVAGALDLGGPAPALDRSYRLGLVSPPLRFGGAAGGRIALDLTRQGSEGFKPQLAAEVTPHRLGALRAGLANGNPAFGVGVHWRRYGFDYAIVSGPTETTQQFAFRVAWGEPVSRYEERQRAEFRQDAQDSLRAALDRRIAAERDRAEQAEREGDHEGALILWEVLQRQDPSEPEYAARAGRARAAIHAEAERALAEAGAQQLGTTLLTLTRDALRRGDLEEAGGVLRALESAAPAGSTFADSVAVLRTEVEAAREAAVRTAVARADSLRASGRPLLSADATAYALRLRPADPGARAAWGALESSIGRNADEARTLARRLEALKAVAEGSRAYDEGRYPEARKAIDRALSLDPGNEEAKAWQARIARRLKAPNPEIDARVRELYIKGMEAFTAGNYREALRNWEQILVLDPLNDSARRNVLEARERLKSEARR
jgi:tetratricopeptide (TPR) repeat protein